MKTTLIQPHQLGDRLSPFLLHLLQMDRRIHLCPMFGDVEQDKGFFIAHNRIHIPYELPLVEHDIAHLCELNNPNRWLMPDFGMRRFEAPRIQPKALFAAFSREVRTRALQMHMMSFRNEKDKLRSTAYSQLNNPYWAEIIKPELPFGRFHTFQDVEMYNADLRERVFQSWNMDRIEDAWKIRLQYIANHMETHVSVSSAAQSY